MRVVSLNGGDPRAVLGLHPHVKAQLLSPKGEVFAIRAPEGAIARPWARLSLWLAGTAFALLGAVVVLRRPDAPVGRLFGVFSGFTGVALGVSPAAGGPHPAWSLVVQFLSLLCMAASLPAFTTAFVGGWRGSRTFLLFFWPSGGILLAGYLASLFIRPSLYGFVRAGLLLYLGAGILTALAVLAWKALVPRSRHSARDARLALAGIACGTLPFAGLTLMAQAAEAHGDVVPAHVTAIIWSIIPMTFTYAILRHQALGIRRLVHRGMVYGVTTVVVLVVMFFLVTAADAFVNRFFGAVPSAFVTAVLLTLGALLFYSLRRGVRRLADRLLYPDEVDPGALLAGIRYDILGSVRSEEVIAAMVERLRNSLRLEAVVLFLGATERAMRAAASAGPRADESIPFVQPRLLELRFGEDGLSEMRWNSDVLIVARLGTGSDTLGFLALGPREKGEVFLREEWHLVETVTPILALAIRETTLLAELRDVSERLTNAQEAERARIARDLHDGPLQKAILLGAVPDSTLRDADVVARELAAELRELCARLRPAILDDLGLVPALEWLLEQTAQGFTVTPRLTLRGMTEDDRLAPNAELALFRVTQEAVNNALRHGHASTIHVSLTRTFDGVQLSVIDDGSGLARDPRCGLGIPGMRERLRQVGGSVVVASNGRTGTMVRASIPYPVVGEQ